MTEEISRPCSVIDCGTLYCTCGCVGQFGACVKCGKQQCPSCYGEAMRLHRGVCPDCRMPRLTPDDDLEDYDERGYNRRRPGYKETPHAMHMRGYKNAKA